ncbi:SUKH-3 domain-containing protein [Streptomyces sp. NBC_01231]|nr:SUKH-3 domain-containing protein [Streptomyces sp. NBC_01231]
MSGRTNATDWPRSGWGITCAKTAFVFDPALLVGEVNRFADWSETIGRDIFPIG